MGKAKEKKAGARNLQGAKERLEIFFKGWKPCMEYSKSSAENSVEMYEYLVELGELLQEMKKRGEDKSRREDYKLLVNAWAGSFLVLNSNMKAVEGRELAIAGLMKCFGEYVAALIQETSEEESKEIRRWISGEAKQPWMEVIKALKLVLDKGEALGVKVFEFCKDDDIKECMEKNYGKVLEKVFLDYGYNLEVMARLKKNLTEIEQVMYR